MAVVPTSSIGRSIMGKDYSQAILLTLRQGISKGQGTRGRFCCPHLTPKTGDG